MYGYACHCILLQSGHFEYNLLMGMKINSKQIFWGNNTKAWNVHVIYIYAHKPSVAIYRPYLGMSACLVISQEPTMK